MSNKPLKVLIIDDSQADFLIVSHELRRVEEFQADVTHCPNPGGCQALLEEDEVDCILLDYMLGADSGLDVLSQIRDAGFDHPVIMLTGQGDEKIAVEAMKREAQDYLVKDGITHLVLRRAITNAVEKVALARRLREQREELEAFVSVVAHDLRNPIFAAHGSLEVIRDFYQDRSLDDRAMELVGGALTSLERMSLLIETLLDYALVGRSEAARSPVRMNDVVKEVVSDLRSAIDECGAAVEVAELPSLIGDRVTLAQLLQNLIANALKFRSEATPVVRVSGKESENEWEISVSDNGIGIAAKHRRNVFKPFHRLHTRAEYSGSGIGLATCQRIVQRHGGQIWVESEPGQGSTFRFALPKVRQTGEGDASPITAEPKLEHSSVLG